MVAFILQVVCAFLIAMGAIFILIEVRAKFDKSFLIFGITDLLLALFCGIDIWLQPGVQTIHWTRIQHVIASFLPAFLLWYLFLVLHQKRDFLIRAMIFAGFCFSILFFTNAMLRPSEKEIVSTLLYDVTFAPYMLVAIAFLLFTLTRNILRREEKEKKVLLFHLLGGIALSAGGILDMINLFIGHRIVPQIATFTTPGALLFGVIVTFVFTDRLTAIIRDRKLTFDKLQEAYREMEEVQSLKELGQSTAIINHEIKNYAFVISGYAQYIHDFCTLPDKFKRMVVTIGETATKMSDFSREILDFSKAKILSDKRPLSIVALIRTCIQTHFSEKQDAIVVEGPGEDISIHGDWNKLEHVFVNIIRNALEAGATKIAITALRKETVLLLIVEDNGVGCSKEQMDSLFKSFYTTKKETGGTGLGMCIMRSVIESHGGHISAYSKNVLNEKEHGLILNIAFPLYIGENEQVEDKKDPVILIKEGVDNLVQVIRVFQNVLVNPHIVQNVEDIDVPKMLREQSAVYSSAGTISLFKKKFGDLGNAHSLVGGTSNVIFVVDERNNREVHAFSENYVLQNMLGPHA
jgi:signal transduction histidine kinase